MGWDLPSRAASLLVAVQMGPHKDETVQTFVKCGAHVDHTNAAGVSILIASCSNEDADPSVVPCTYYVQKKKK